MCQHIGKLASFLLSVIMVLASDQREHSDHHIPTQDILNDENTTKKLDATTLGLFLLTYPYGPPRQRGWHPARRMQP